ncbi:MAG TPA: hypothetical protein VNV62_18540 [Trebonia sp.]|nr:hypothetical protein [Trebonia sp.]
MKDGLRPPAMPAEPEGDAEPEGPAVPGGPADPDAAGEPDEPGDAAESDGPVFNARAANQLFVAAIACLTAWRPLSSTPLPDPAVSPRPSSSAF